MPAIEAWIITLNPHSDAVQSLSSALSSQGFRVHYYAAVDGRQQMPELKEGERISELGSLINRKAPLTRSEVGCYLSHFRLIKQAHARGAEQVVIFEDDVIVEEGLYQVIKEILKLDSSYHLVRLMSLKLRKRNIIKPLFGDYQLVRATRGTLGTQGYVLNRQGMEKIIKFGATLRMPIDKVYDSFFMFGLNCYNVEPHLIHEQVHQSSIKKTDGNIDNRWLINLGWRVNKFNRSVMRKLNYLMNFKEFSRATMPSKTVGKSARLRS